MVDQLLKRTPSGSEPVAYTLTTAGATLVGSGSKVADYPTLFAGVVMVIVGALIRLQIIGLEYKYGEKQTRFESIEGAELPAKETKTIESATPKPAPTSEGTPGRV